MKILHVNITRVIWFCVLGQSVFAAADVSKLAERAINAKGADYVAARNELVKYGETNQESFKIAMEQSDDWRMQTMLVIAKEHIQKQDAVNELLKWTPKRISSRLFDERVHSYGEQLKEKGRRTPLVLVEKIWKGNEINFVRNTDENIAICAYTLGELRTQEARRPLEMLLRHDNLRVRVESANALGKLKNPESALPLLKYVIKGHENNIDVTHLAALEAFTKCATKDIVPTLKGTLSLIEKGEIKDETRGLRATLETLVMALDR